MFKKRYKIFIVLKIDTLSNLNLHNIHYLQVHSLNIYMSKYRFSLVLTVIQAYESRRCLVSNNVLKFNNKS